MAQSIQLTMGSATAGKSRRLILIAWLFSAIIVLSLAFTYYGIGLLSAGRAYVGGEGLWSKAQKDMTYALGRYARLHDRRDYQAYLDSRAVILGDRQARLELDKPNPDLQVVRAGFLQGRNHPDDIDGMVRLVRDFRRVPDIEKAIDIWSRADVEIDHLIALATRIDQAVQSGNSSEAAMLPYLDELHTLNQRLTPLEDAFSFTLGEAARKTQLVLVVLLFAGVAMFLGAAFLFSTRLVRQSEQIESASRQGEIQFRGLLQFAPMPIVIVRLADKSIRFANEHALAQFKMSTERMDTVHSSDFYVDLGDRERLVAHLQHHQSANDWEIRLHDSQGKVFWASMSSQCITYYGDECVLTALTNIDARKCEQQELHRRAFHDELTGLPNRAMFMASLEHTFAEKRCSGGTFALMFLDLDRFKVVNDELGHAAGDKLLQEVATRVRASAPAADIVARLGGDEFVILVTDQAEPERLQRTAHNIMAALRSPVWIDKSNVDITASIGISCYPRDGDNLMDMMKSADLAMYRAKEQGRDNFQWYGEAGSAAEPRFATQSL
ncbi:GGDEF domain-containing protein [Massilia sp. CF038]|uniref:GGDEF domain-containing protein n=1 Tax=Massilia sp. CF038 TaxID=1881045 RepID=UPI0009189402|nr:GGDEF domain-containing protein [Massilia sp. CF038]SHH57192.1 diguanylate cyclase (GGDEF) domain-containing protein [Massilia sp. CF038]